MKLGNIKPSFKKHFLHQRADGLLFLAGSYSSLKIGSPVKDPRYIRVVLNPLNGEEEILAPSCSEKSDVYGKHIVDFHRWLWIQSNWRLLLKQ